MCMQSVSPHLVHLWDFFGSSGLRSVIFNWSEYWIPTRNIKRYIFEFTIIIPILFLKNDNFFGWLFNDFFFRPGHTSEVKTNYKASFVNALDPVVSSLTETGGDASSTSTVAISTKTNR